MKRVSVLLNIAVLLFIGCENKDINEGEEFRPRPVRDSFEDSHFSKVTVDGVEYLMMERDNNNPHEGFGFMALRANKLMEKQDTIMAYLQTIAQVQHKLYARLYGVSEQDAEYQFDTLFSNALKAEQMDLLLLNQETLSTEEQ